MKETKAEKFKRWKNRIDIGLNWINEQKKDWQDSRDAYDGKILRPEQSDSKDVIVSVNLQYVDVRSTIPKLYSQNPYIYIDPETPEADLKAEVMEPLVNVLASKRWHLKQRMRDAIKAAKLDGRSYLKVSYKFKKDLIGREYVGDQPNDEICIDVVLRKDLIIPRDCTSVYNARWLAHRVQDQIGNIREKFNLKPTDKPLVIEDRAIEGENKMSDEEKEDFQYGEYFEIEDRVNRTLEYIVSGVDRIVQSNKFPYDFYTMYEPVEWNDIPGNNDTHCDLHFWKRQLMQIAEDETMRYNHSRKLNAKYIHQGPQKLDEDQIHQLTSYKDSTYLYLGPGHSITPLQHAQMGQEFYLGTQSTRQDAMIVSGMNEMKQGLPQSRKTAREAMAIVAESQDVIGDRAALVEDVVARVIEKCIILIQTFYDSTRVMAITGMEQAEFLGLQDRTASIKKQNNGIGIEVLGSAKKPFISFTGNRDLVGKMGIRIKAGSARPVDENQRKEDFMLLMQAGSANPIFSSAIDPKEALKDFAKILHIENKNIIIDPKSPEQENALLKRNIPVMPNISENHEEHIARHERENNGTDAYVMHLLGHKLLKSFVQNSKLQAPTQLKQAGELSQDNISGLPQGSSVPPSAMPRPTGGMTPSMAPPETSGLSN